MSTIVLHNLPVGCMESDIHRALLIYGTAVNIVMDTRISQAVVTMRTQQEAQALLNRHSVNVSGTSVRVDTQQSQPPLPPSQPQQQVPTPQQHVPPQAMGMPSYPYATPQGAMYTATPPAHPPMPQPYYAPPMMSGGYAPSSLPPPSPMSMGSGNAIMPAPPQTSKRLKVVVEDCRYPITRDVLVRMFGMIAPPVVVTCGPYGPTTTGMVEFADAAAAQQAVDQFHGKAVYPDSCYVKLMFEPMWEVSTPGAGVSATPAAMGVPPTEYPYHSTINNHHGGMPGSTSPYAPQSNAADPNARYPGWNPRDESGNDAYAYASESFAAPPSSVAGRGHGFAQGGDGRREYVSGVGHGNGRGGTAPHGLMVRGGRGAARGSVRGGGGAVGQAFNPYAASASAAPYPSAPRPAGENAGAGAGGRPTAAAPPTDCAVLVSGVAESVPLYDLWVLLEVYGNVKSLKRQHTDRTQVVAQFYHVADTGPAVQYLHGCPFRGSKLRLKRFLGYQERNTEWNVGPATDPSTFAALFEKDYHHRVSPFTPRNPRSAMYPAPNLFISSLAEEVSDADVDAMWKRCGFEPVASYRRGPKASIVGFKDVETAVNALIVVHLKECRGHTLYATFSRFPPGPRPTKSEHTAEQDGEQEENNGGEGVAEKGEAVPPAEVPAPQEQKDENIVKEDSKAAPKSSKHKGKSAK